MCELLEGLMWGRPRNGTAETWEGSGHMWRKPSFPGMCSVCWALSSVLLAVVILHGSDSPGFLHSGPRSSPQSGQVQALPSGYSVVIRS